MKVNSKSPHHLNSMRNEVHSIFPSWMTAILAVSGDHIIQTEISSGHGDGSGQVAPHQNSKRRGALNGNLKMMIYRSALAVTVSETRLSARSPQSDPHSKNGSYVVETVSGSDAECA